MRIMHLTRASLMVKQFFYPMIEKQQATGHFVCACGSDDLDADDIERDGYVIYRHHQKRTLNPLNALATVKEVVEIIKDNNIEVLVAHTPLGSAIGRMAGFRAKIPVIYFAHGLPCAPHQNKLKWLVWYCFEKFFSYFTDMYIVMNKYDYNLCKKSLAGSKAKVVKIEGMGVDLNRFSNNKSSDLKKELCHEFDIPIEKKLVFSAAFLVKEKGIFDYFNAAKTVLEQRNDVVFLLAGIGPCEKELELKIKKHNMEKEFILLGWRNDVSSIMSAIDIFTLPSYYFEGLPVSILEAMACEKPVVSTLHRGCEDAIVDSETGLLVPIKSPNKLAEAFLVLVDSATLRSDMGKSGRQRVENVYDINVCTDNICSIIDSFSINK